MCGSRLEHERHLDRDEERGEQPGLQGEREDVRERAARLAEDGLPQCVVQLHRNKTEWQERTLISGG